MKDLPADVKSERLHRLIELGKAAEEKFIKARLGREYALITEEFNGGYTCGYTGNYIRVFVAGEHKGRINVRLKKIFRDGALAEIAD